MATETLNVSGLSASDSGQFSGSVTDIDEAVASADGNVMSSSTNGEGETLRVALTNTSASITDDVVISNVSVTLRGSAPSSGNNSFDVELFIGGATQGSANTGQVTGSLANYSGLNNAGWNTDWTKAQLDGAEILITCVQNGKGVNTQYNVDCLDVIITYSQGPVESLEHYRFTYDQNNNDTSATTGFNHESATDFPFATGSVEDTAWTTAELDTTYCLVAKVYNSGDTSSGSIHQLEFRVNTGAGFGSWTTCNASSTPVQMVDGSDDDLQTSAVERLSATAAASYKGSIYEETAGNASLSLAADEDGEAHYSLQFLSSGLSTGDQIEFRINNTSDTKLVTNTVTPSVTIGGAITQTVNQATETDTAQPITVDPQHRLVGQATETDTAQTITPVVPQVIAVGQATETDTAQTITPSLAKVIAVNQATETDTAQAIGRLKTAAVGQATETDTAQALTGYLGPKVWLNSTATLTGATAMTVTAWSLDGTSVTFSDPQDAQTGSLWLGVENVQAGGGEANTGWIAVTVTASGLFATVNQASETDTAQAIALELRRLVTQATETDTAQPITVNPQRRLVSPASETDTAQPITSATRRLIGQATETDAAQPITLETRRLVGQATETDTAQPISAPGNINVPLNQASETDTAQPITVDPQHRLVGLVTETDVAQPFTVLKTRAIGQATETDTAQAMTGYLGPKAWLNTVANGPTLTGATQMTVTAWSLDGTSVTFSDPVGAPIGSNIWFGIENVQAGGGEANTGWIQVTVTASGFQVTVNQASETDIAQAITLELRRLVTQTTETDTAQPFTVLKTRSVGQATETDTAQPIIRPAGQVIPVGQAIETDTAQPITWEVRRLVGLASETDFALPITVVGGVADVEQGGGSGGHGAVILPPRPYEDAVPEPPPGVSMDEMLAALVVIDLDQNGYD